MPSWLACWLPHVVPPSSQLGLLHWTSLPWGRARWTMQIRLQQAPHHYEHRSNRMEHGREHLHALHLTSGQG